MTAGFYQNPYLPHSLRTGGGATAPAARKPKQIPITKDVEGLPVGTAAQVMAWVGDDPDRAQAFLTKEQRETRPRVSLVANLKAVLKRHEIIATDPPTAQLAPQIDVVPAERAAIAEGEPIADVPIVNQLEMIRDRLKVEGQ